MKKNQKILSQERLREIAWEVRAKYPIPLTGDYIALLMVHPRLGYVHWHIREESVEAINATHGEGFNGSHLVVRVYDVTDILFDGLNAHMFFDLEINGLSGNYYFAMDRLGSNYLAEIGFRFADGSFHYLARSGTTYFDRDRPSGNYQIAGLFVEGTLNKIFSVENIFDAPVYERMNHELAGINRKKPLSLEERWFFEAITETYIPIIKFLNRLIEKNVSFKLTISISPSLLAMMEDRLLQERYLAHLCGLIELSEKELERTRHEPHFHWLAGMYRYLFMEAREVYVNHCNGKLSSSFKRFIENNSISEDHISALEQMDNIFPNVDYRLFR